MRSIKGDELGGVGVLAIVGSVIGVICTAAYGIYLQMSGGSFDTVGYYFDPMHPTKAAPEELKANESRPTSPACSHPKAPWMGVVRFPNPFANDEPRTFRGLCACIVLRTS